MGVDSARCAHPSREPANEGERRSAHRPPGLQLPSWVDSADDLDQGLIFVAFNQDIQRQFATIQARLRDEPMLDYITPVGGGYFFAPPGARGEGDWVGSGLLS